MELQCISRKQGRNLCIAKDHVDSHSCIHEPRSPGSEPEASLSVLSCTVPDHVISQTVFGPRKGLLYSRDKSSEQKHWGRSWGQAQGCMCFAHWHWPTVPVPPDPERPAPVSLYFFICSEAMRSHSIHTTCPTLHSSLAPLFGISKGRQKTLVCLHIHTMLAAF